MDLASEPVRGGRPPAGFYSLSGLEQARAFAQGLVPRAPIERLFGIRATHAAPGTATLTMAASPWLAGYGGQIVLPLVRQSMYQAARTVAPAGSGVGHIHLFANFVRVATAEMDNFVSRARVLMAGPNRVTTEASLEDASGRLVVHATGQFVISPISPPPPPAPRLERHEEPTYATPDPPQRPLDENASFFRDRELRPGPGSTPGAGDFIQFLKQKAEAGEAPPSPYLQLLGARVVDAWQGGVELATPAHEWLSNEWGRLGHAISAILFGTASTATVTALPPGKRAVASSFHNTDALGEAGLEVVGHAMRTRGKVTYADDNVVITDAEAFDVDGNALRFARGTYFIVDRVTVEPTAERTLTTVLFADVVDSTLTAERMGDARWRELLEQNRELIRRSLKTSRARERKTEGDGFLATFDSPIQAVRCARAVRDGARSLGLQMRTGIHLGEVEVMGAEIAGIGVHVAARVQAAADPGAILVTSTVREAMSGSGVTFTSRGAHRLKGVADEWHLYAVED